MAAQGDFTNNLSRVYTMYTGSFLVFVLLMWGLEALGVPNRIIGYLFVFMTIAVYAGIGILSRTMQVSEYYVAGRKVPAVYNGMATAADWMSAASFIAMAGTLYAQGYNGLAFILGWTGGYVLVAVLIAPYLRKFGAYTVPDFLGSRFGGNFARSIGIIILMTCSFVYIMGQLQGSGTIAARLLGIPVDYGIFVGLAGILVCSMLGGMRAVTWTQVAQYIVLIIAYLIPVVMLSAERTGVPIPQLMYGQVLERISALETQHAATYLAGAAAHVVPRFDGVGALNFFSLILCLMVGTAALPHVLMRFFTTPSVREARVSVGWTLLFIFLLYFTAPAYAAFAKLEVYENVLGRSLASLQDLQSLPRWVYTYGQLELVKICGVNATTPEALFQACQAANVTTLNFRAFSIAPDVVVIATPEIAGLPYVIAGLVAAGGLAAALSTADGLLLAIANALSHDVYYRMIDPKASTKTRLVVARVLLVGVALLAAIATLYSPGSILALVAWAFSLAAAGLFPVLVLGVWWRRTTSAGAIAGMISGFGITLFYLMWTHPTWGFGQPVWFGVQNISAGLFGIPVGFVVTYVVSLMTPAPSKEMMDFIDSIRLPKGEAPMERELKAKEAGVIGH